MTWGAVAGAAVGVVGNALMSDGGGGGGSTTSSGSMAPWDPMQKYLVGDTQTRRLKAGVQPVYSSTGVKPDYETWRAANPGRSFFEWAQIPEDSGDRQLLNPESDYETVGQKGIADIAYDLYGTTGMDVPQQNVIRAQRDWLHNLGNSGLIQGVYGAGGEAVGGKFDTNLSAVDPADLVRARAGQGALDPTYAMSGLLSGSVNTAALDPVIDNATRRLTQNFNEQVMPGINQGAVMAGQYGGSRQGIAQGIASRGLAQSIGDMEANLYNQAYQSAQDKMYGTANALNSQAGQNAQFNSNLQLQNNAQRMQQAQQNLNNRVTGANLITGGIGAGNNLFGAYNATADVQRNAPWEDLARYQSVIQPIAGMGNATTQSTPYYTNPVGNIVGGAMTGYRIGQNFGGNSGGLLGGGYTGGDYMGNSADLYSYGGDWA